MEKLSKIIIVILITILHLTSCNEKKNGVTKQDLDDLKSSLSVTYTETLHMALSINDLGGGWFGKDTDGDGDYESIWNDHGETPPDGEEGPDIADEVYHDRNNDGMWDEWWFDSDDDEDKNWEHGKKDTDNDGKFDREWEESKDDANGNKKADEEEWREIEPEDPEYDHPKDI